MEWAEIRNQHPDKFILLGDIIEEKISETESRIVKGTILKVSDEAKEIRQLYKWYKKQGDSVLYALPSTPDEFIVENVLYIMRSEIKLAGQGYE